MGDGIGGTEKKIGATTTTNECASMVKENEPSANGATWGDGGCYAEFGATGTNFNDEWQTCRFEGRFIMLQKIFGLEFINIITIKLHIYGVDEFYTDSYS